MALARSATDATVLISIRHLQDLITPNAMTNDDVMSLYLDRLCHACPQVSYVKPQFSDQLRTDGWEKARTYFAACDRLNLPHSFNCPRLTGERTILFPFFINMNH